MIVDVFGIEAFLPGSQIDVKPIRDYDIFVGKTMEFILIKFNHFFGMAYAAPREVCDMDKTVNTAKVDEYTVSGDVLDNTFEYLTALKLGNDLFLLLLKLGFDKSLVRYNNVLEFLIS